MHGLLTLGRRVTVVVLHCVIHSQWRSQDFLSTGHKMGALARPKNFITMPISGPKVSYFASARERCSTISLVVDQPKISVQAKKLLL